MFITDSNQYAIELVTYLLVLIVYFYEFTLSKSESVKFSLIEPVICIFTDSSVRKYSSLLNQLISTDLTVKQYFSLLNQLIFTEVISEI